MPLEKGRNPGKKKPSAPARVNPLTPPALMGRPSAPRPPAIAPTRPNSVSQLIDTYKKPGTGVGKPVSKSPLLPPSLTRPAAPKAAPKAPSVPRNTAAPVVSRPVGGVGGGGGGGPVGSSAPVGGAPKAPAAKPAGGSVEQIKSAAQGLAQYMSTASAAVQAELLPQLNELNRQIADMQTRGQRDMDRTDQRGRATQSDLGELFGRLGNFTGEIQKASTKNYQGLQEQTGSAYDKLKAALGSTYGGQIQQSNDEMARLGLQGTTPNANEKLTRDQGFLTGLADVDKTAAVTGLGNSQNSFDQLMSMARGNAATEGAVRVGQSKRDTDRAMNDIMFELESGVRNLSGKRGDIEATRGERTRQIAEAMEEKAYGRNVEAQDRELQNRIAEGRFGIEKQAAAAALQPVGSSEADQIDLAMKQIQLDNMIAEQSRQTNLGTGVTYRIDPRTGRRIISGTGNQTPGIPTFTPNR